MTWAYSWNFDLHRWLNLDYIKMLVLLWHSVWSWWYFAVRVVCFSLFRDSQKLNFRNNRNLDSNKRFKTQNLNTRVIMIKLETQLDAILIFFDTRTRSKFKFFETQARNFMPFYDSYKCLNRSDQNCVCKSKQVFHSCKKCPNLPYTNRARKS